MKLFKYYLHDGCSEVITIYEHLSMRYTCISLALVILLGVTLLYSPPMGEHSAMYTYELRASAQIKHMACGWSHKPSMEERSILFSRTYIEGVFLHALVSVLLCIDMQ